MSKQRILSGKEVIKIFERLGFSMISQTGSHVKLRRIVGNEKQTLLIPNHKDMDRGTLLAIFNQALKYIPKEKLHPYFYVD